MVKPMFVWFFAIFIFKSINWYNWLIIINEKN